MTATYALIPAAGRGVRFGSSENKIFAPLLDRPILAWSLQVFAASDKIDGIVLVGNEADFPRLRPIVEAYGAGKVILVAGGVTRQESVRLGLQAIPASVENVIVHDAARPCLRDVDAYAPIFWLRKFEAFTYAWPVTDTLVREGNYQTIADLVPRDGLWCVQTPQAFRRADLVRAHEKALEDGFEGTDDTSLVRRIGIDVTLVKLSNNNIKITHASDLSLAEMILSQRPSSPKPGPPFRVGHGYDVHEFADGRPMWLGGVLFPESPRGLLGHSDADALLHAVCDALLGAAGLGDIGKLFPPSDNRHKDRASIEFLDEVAVRLGAEGWQVGNVDITVIAEYPKIGPRAEAIKQKIAVSLGVDAAQISVKATTNEKMGFVGRGEGIAVHATALLYR